MSKLKFALRVFALYMLPACAGSQLFLAHASRVVMAGTTTTYGGNPACDCGGGNTCGCILPGN